jgi:WXG100 family type VII secretion target
VPNVNVTYDEMQSAARQLQAARQRIEDDLRAARRLVDNLVAAGYVTDRSSRQFQASYTEFDTGATRMMEGLGEMSQYLTTAAQAFGDTDVQLAAALHK